MTEPRFTDDILMAYADGELDSEIRRAVDEAVAKDADLARRVDRFAESRQRAKAALDPLLDEPVPDDLHARIAAMVEETPDVADETGNVVSFAPRAKAPVWQLPLAASIALVAGGLIGFIAATSTDDEAGQIAAVDLDRPEIVNALTSVASGNETAIGGDRFRAIATYTEPDGSLCREFEVDHADRSTVVAVACREDNRWALQFTVVAGQASTGYAPASSLEALDAYLTAVDASAPMSVEAEAAALEALR